MQSSRSSSHAAGPATAGTQRVVVISTPSSTHGRAHSRAVAFACGRRCACARYFLRQCASHGKSLHTRTYTRTRTQRWRVAHTHAHTHAHAHNFFACSVVCVRVPYVHVLYFFRA